MAENPELEARLVTHPEIETFLVYGDWLAEHGDPRGELVAVQAKLMADPGDRELRTRESQLLDTHRHEWLGELADVPREHLVLTWFCGFIEHVQITGPTTSASQVRVLPILAKLLALPGIDLMRSLAIQLERRAPRFEPCLDALADRAPRSLTALELCCPKWGPSTFGGLAKLSAAFPGLRRLAIEMSSAPALSTARFPVLRHLELDCAVMAGPDYQELARFESLETLVISVGDESFEHAASVEDVGVLLRHELPSLRHLGLHVMQFGDLAIPLLAESPLVRRLQTLSLDSSEITEAGAALVTRHLDAFAHLAELGLSHTLIPPHICRDLERAHAFITAERSRYRDESYDDVYDY